MPKITFDLPVKKHVRSFLESKFGNPCFIERREPEGKYFYALLAKQSKGHDSEFAEYSSTIRVGLTISMHFRHGSIMTPTAVIEFNNYIDEHIKKEQRSYIHTQVTYNQMEIKRAVELFQQDYGFQEDDYAAETIRKDYYRWILKLKKDGKEPASPLYKLLSHAA